MALSKPYTGKILWVDLTRGLCQAEAVPDHIYDQFLGGMGLAAAVLYARIPPGADPLGPENVLGLVPGLLTGTGSLFTGRWMVAGKSPLTGTWGDANCGGYLAPAIKQCGYDGIFICGASPKPVYLYVDGNQAELKDAAHLWGLDTTETEQRLWAEAPGVKHPAVACIGPAGEKRSLIAGLCHDGGRLAARSGLGAVMGAKRLKAVVLAGARPIGCAQPAAVKALSRRCAPFGQFSLPFPSGAAVGWIGVFLRQFPFAVALDGALSVALYRRWGTSSMNQGSVEWGDTPVKNWAGSLRDFPWRLSQAVNPDHILAREVRKYHCYSCPLGCGGICRLGEGQTHKPEYETTMAFSSLLLNTDLEAVFTINEKLNRAGMDSISAGGAVAFALEAYEQGLLTPADTGGLELKWGDARAITALVDQMIAREGIGAWLADGAKRAATHLGHGAEAFAIQAGGQEIALHDSRLDPGYALHASVDPTPGRHTTGAQTHYELYRLWTKIKSLPGVPLLYSKNRKFRADRETAVAAAATSAFTQLYNAAGLCMFGALLGVERLPIFEWLNAALGWERSPEAYLEIGRRIQTLRQLFNVRQGIDPRTLRISARALGVPPQRAGANRGRSVALEALMQAYWAEMGWDAETGVPRPETLEALGLAALAAEAGGEL